MVAIHLPAELPNDSDGCKFGPAVKSKTFTAQVNEILCKVLCHNLSCLVMAMHTLAINPSFLGLGEVSA
ncbi:MAG: hypothetical protein ABSB49_13765 [Polyangia bacterium]